MLQVARARMNDEAFDITHKFLQQHHYLSPEPPNDFAYWVSNVLNESRLGEELSSIDIIQFHKISELRNRFTTIISNSRSRDVPAPEGEEFYFMASQTFVLELPHTAGTLKEFADCLRNISIHSIYYHIFDARLRLERPENDFSVWFRRMGYESLANDVRRLDPYTLTLEGLRRRIIQLIGRYDTH